MTKAADRYAAIVRGGATAHQWGLPLSDNPYETDADKTAWGVGWLRSELAESKRQVDKQKPIQVDVTTNQSYGTPATQEGAMAWARAHNEGTDAPECPYLEGTRAYSHWWAGTNVAHAFIKKALDTAEEEPSTDYAKSSPEDSVKLDLFRRTAEHPLTAVLLEVVHQCNVGKGERHGGCATPFLEQPWKHYAKLHGRGFLTGQAAKKLEEAASKREGDAFVNEMLGAIAYCGMAILYERSLRGGELRGCPITDEGAKAFLAGVPVVDNPYRAGSILSGWWSTGWWYQADITRAEHPLTATEVKASERAVYSAAAADFEDALHGKKSS